MEMNQEFEIFWKSCPRRIGKGEARKAFIRARKSVEFHVLLSGIETYSEHCRKEVKESRYICHPATWLNQERWEDEYDDGNTESARRGAAFDRVFGDSDGEAGSGPVKTECNVVPLDGAQRSRDGGTAIDLADRAPDRNAIGSSGRNSGRAS